YAAALENSTFRTIDLSYDHRFNNKWVYGLTEKNRVKIKGASKVSNPGCYSTGAQLGLMPLKDKLSTAPIIFGISGYSGAGRIPSDKNNKDILKNNILPYALTGHGHEAEISHHLCHDVSFIPHVAPHFRGISLSIQFALKSITTADDLLTLFKNYYKNEHLVKVSGAIPEIQSVANSPYVNIGGFKVDNRDPTKGVFVVTLDNLLKGAASQALQNINLMLGFSELKGIKL
ncbi:MAG: Asd/ArgC dimerization domain-containing protein, partial [Sphingomonadales bacterium]